MDSPFFFHTKEFVYRNPDPSIVHFQADGCSIYFSIVNKKLISLPKSTFGGFVIAEDFDLREITSLLNKGTLYAQNQKCESIEIKCGPEIFSKHSSKINEVLLSTGFSVEYKDVTQILFCDRPLHLSLLRRRMLSHSVDARFTFLELDKNSLPQAYDLFLQSRKNKNYPVTMRLHDFQAAFDKFPDRYFLYGVLDVDKIIAACVVIKVNEDILYYFFPGDDLAYRKKSPATFLIYNLFNEAVRKKYQMIDLGISTDKGILNKGLYDFKKSFGATDSLKLTFEKTI